MRCSLRAEDILVVALAVGLIVIAGFFLLAMRRAPLWQWAVGALILGLLSRVTFDAGIVWSLLSGWTIVALIPAIILALLSVTAIRRAVVAQPAYGLVKSILPRVSRTEQEALDAGTVGWDAELFSGRPQWEKLSGIPKGRLSDEEQAFLDGPVPTVCSMIAEWDVRHNRADLPPEVWPY